MEKFSFKCGRSGDFIRMGLFERIIPVDGSEAYRNRTLAEIDLTPAQAVNMGRDLLEQGHLLWKEQNGE